MTEPAIEQPPALIEREGLTLRRWQPADADDLAGVVRASLDHLAPWMPWAVPGYGRESAAQFIEHSIQGWADGSVYNYAIVGGSIAGSCGLMRRIGPGGMEIGYWVAKDQTRRGLATRATEVLTEEAFTLSGIDRVEIWTDELNEASAAIPARLGFTRVGTEPSERAAPGGTGVCVVWRLTRPSI